MEMLSFTSLAELLYSLLILFNFSKSLTLKSVPLGYGSCLESPSENSEKSDWKFEGDVKSSPLYHTMSLRVSNIIIIY